MSFISLTDVNLFYEIRGELRIKNFIVPQGSMKSNLTEGKKIHAIKKMNLQLEKGDFLGVVGSNGAGKSSLLKLLAGIYPPSNGDIEIKGRIAPMFELATGFEMESTGWENIKARGIMLGLTPKQVLEKVDDIAEFSELGEYLSIPVKYYSSGMFVRLAFAISTAIEPEILLLDEVMAAGDAKFLKKAEIRMQEMVDRVNILVFVSHSMKSIEDMCNRAIWLDSGVIRASGKPKEVIDMYLKFSNI